MRAATGRRSAGRGCGSRRAVFATAQRPRRRDFSAPAPNRLWVADISYLRTWEGWLYIAVVVDYSRRVVGWSIADHIRAELVVDALEMALDRRRPEPGLVHHSDQGSQYVSLALGQRCRRAGIELSMGARGCAYDNAVCEAFFKTLKSELVDRRSWPTKPRHDTPSSTSSRPSTTAADATQRSATSHPPNRKRSPKTYHRVSVKAGKLHCTGRACVSRPLPRARAQGRRRRAPRRPRPRPWRLEVRHPRRQRRRRRDGGARRSPPPASPGLVSLRAPRPAAVTSSPSRRHGHRASMILRVPRPSSASQARPPKAP